MEAMPCWILDISRSRVALSSGCGGTARNFFDLLSHSTSCLHLRKIGSRRQLSALLTVRFDGGKAWRVAWATYRRPLPPLAVTRIPRVPSSLCCISRYDASFFFVPCEHCRFKSW